MELPKRETRGLGEDNKGDATRNCVAIEIATQKLTKKIFQLQLLEVMARETGINLGLKEKEVTEQKRKLEELQYQKWAKLNDFCDRMWSFSSKNDLIGLFNKYLDLPKLARCKSLEIGQDRHPEVLQLKNEVDNLNRQLANKKARTLDFEEKLLQAKIQLKVAESYRENDPEINRLTRDIEKYENEVTALETRIWTIEREKSRQRSQRFSNPDTPVKTNTANFVTAAELMAKEENETIKRSKFSVKTESAISRKLARTHGRDRCN